MKWNAITEHAIYIVTVVAHVLWGLQPVFSRYMQRLADSPVPALSLLTVGFSCVLVLYSPKVLLNVILFYREKSKNEPITKARLKQGLRLVWTDFILNWRLWAFGVALVFRTITNILSSRFTSAIYVQLVGITAPFFISFFTIVFMRNTRDGKMDRLTWKTFITLITTVIGCLLIILGGVHAEGHQQEWWQVFTNFTIQWQHLGSNLTEWDGIGIGIAVLSTIFYAGYMMLIKKLRIAMEASNSELIFITTGESLFLFQTVCVVAALVIPSSLIDDWTPWLHLSRYDWFMFFTYAIVLLLFAQLLSVISLQKLGATTVGNTIAIRLISAIIFSAIILKEQLQSMWQLIGSVIVLVSVTAFLILQSRQHKQFIEDERRLKENLEIEEQSVEMENFVADSGEEVTLENDSIQLVEERDQV